MKTSKYTEEQIVYALRQVEAGEAVVDVCRRLGISQQTFLCRATLGFGRFRTARITIGGFESMRIIRKRQVRAEGNTSAEIFYSVAA